MLESPDELCSVKAPRLSDLEDFLYGAMIDSLVCDIAGLLTP